MPIKLQPAPYKPTGVLGLITAGMLYVEFVDDAMFDDCIIALESEVRSALDNLIGEGLLFERGRLSIFSASMDGLLLEGRPLIGGC